MDPVTAAIQAVGQITSSIFGNKAAKNQRKGMEAAAKGQIIASQEQTKQADYGNRSVNTTQVSGMFNNLLSTSKGGKQTTNTVIVVGLFLVVIVGVALKKRA